MQQAWKKALGELGYVMPPDMYEQAIGRTAPDIFALWRKQLGTAVPLDKLQARVRELVDDDRHRNGIELMPGARDLLGYLADNRNPCGLATSSFRVAADRKIRRAMLQPYFTMTVCGDEIVNGKPAPDIFIEGARLLGRLPADCLAIEDSENGVRSAFAAGMPVVMVPDVMPATEELRAMTVAVFCNFFEVRNWLQSKG